MNPIKYMFRRNQMEIIIGLVIAAGIAWFFFMRNDKKSDEVTSVAPNNVTAPYKVPEPAATTPIPLVAEVVPAVAAKKKPAPKKPAAAPEKPVAAKASARKPRAPKV
jgi:predicted negative regulator of RcsB-dependent stress response